MEHPCASLFYSIFMCKKTNVVYFVVVCVLMLTIFNNTSAFNIDVKNYHTWKGQDDTQFGYTLAFDESARQEGKVRLLVGAPKAVTEIRGKSIKSGIVHGCTLESGDFNCPNTSYHFPEFFNDPLSAQNEGFGSSLAITKQGKFVECAPYWRDTSYVGSDHTFVPGRCVLKQGTTTFEEIAPYFHTKDTANFYLHNKDYNHGFALFGFSTDSTKDSTFVFGSPGLTIFEGGIDIRDHKNWKFSTTVKSFRNTMQTKTAYGYLGYAVKIGKFCDEDICFAAGAPNLFTFGMVKLYQWYGQRVLDNFQDIQGDKTWSYFGSVLGAVDADKSGIDELLIGAPYYGHENSDSFDKGRVFVYARDEKTKQFKLHITLDGSGSAFSRFGSSIQAIGDINLDGYEDVAIGAPGEEDGTGCVYIYIGSKTGLSTEYSQRICRDEIPDVGQLNGFGSTISASTQLPNSPYPTFAVSSYLNDTIFMFNSRLVVIPSVQIHSNPNPLDLTKPCGQPSSVEPCILFEVCFTHKIKGMPTMKLNFIADFELDTQRRSGNQRRVQFIDSSGSLVDSLKSVPLKGVEEIGSCDKYLVVTEKTQISKDRFTPIEMKVTVELDKGNPVPGIDPVIDPTTSNVFTHMVSLANDCGSDNICNVDLAVEGSVTFPHQDVWPFVVVGHTKELQVDLTIFNTEETSYGVRITTKLSQPLRFLRFNSDTIKQCKPDSAISSNPAIVCNYYHPLRQDSSLALTLVFDTMNVAMDERSVKIEAKAMPTDTLNSPETNPDNNKIEIITPVYIVADVNVYGTSSPTEVTIKKAKTLSLLVHQTIKKKFKPIRSGIDPFILNHKFQMKNLGPSFLPRTNMYLSIPAYLPDTTQLLSDASVQLKLGDNAAIPCTNIVTKIDERHTIFPTNPTVKPSAETKASVTTQSTRDPKETTTEWSPAGTITKRKKRAAGNQHSTTYFLTCQSSPEYCIHFKCDLQKNIKSGGHVQLNVTFEIDKRNIPIPKGFTSFYMQLESFVAQPKHLLFKPWNITSRQEASTRTSTIFHKVDSGETINIWIIIGSVIAGLVLILIIVVIVWKLGFFKRKNHQEVNEWKRKSQRYSRPPKFADNKNKEEL